MANMRNQSFNQNSDNTTNYKCFLRKICKELKVNNGGDFCGPGIILSFTFSCDEILLNGFFYRLKISILRLREITGRTSK